METQSKEFQFYIRTDLSEYAGKYIAIVGDKVMASGYNAKEVLDRAKRKTGKTATLAKIPKEELLIL